MEDRTQPNDSLASQPDSLGVLEFDGDTFVFEAVQRPLVSSGGKRVYRGTYHAARQEPGHSTQAVAKFYAPEAIEKFGREAAALARGSIIGVGPKLLRIASAALPEGGAHAPLIIEEHAGVPLSEVLEGAAIPPMAVVSAGEQALCVQEGDARNRQLSKVIHDLALHVYRMHASGVCHGDLKASNVCVRSIGEHPWDIRATLIDFDLESPVGGRLPRERTAAYFDTLFDCVPRALGAAEALRPSPMELDLACLEAVCLELKVGRRIDEMDPLTVAEGLAGGIGVFRYTECGGVRVRPIDSPHDIAPYAAKAGMIPVEEWFGARSEAFAQRARALATAELKGSAFLDVQDIRAIEANPEMEAILREDDIARAVFDTYRKSLIAAGETSDYESFELQPLELQESCYGQAADLCQKMERLGFALVREGGPSADDHVECLDEEQVDTLARWEHERWLAERLRMGWTYDSERNAVRKTSPYLIPYDELDEEVRETRNRAPMRESLALLASAGLAVVPREALGR